MQIKYIIYKMYKYNKLKLIGYDSDIENDNDKQNNNKIEFFCNFKK